MTVWQSNRFKKSYKKLPANKLTAVNRALQTVIDNPDIGEKKTGNLSWLRVHKFKFSQQQILIAYRLDGENLTFLDLGSHENFYRDLSRN
ncbi:MAG: type II toxin-antitoxin system RelE/ParE family toxin [Planctomycetota bacterium]|jgi:mRNA-degrading endonuclease RelE of RelBE toxin-antitoxin system|nr:type II toxin-antitoxin system RelE/ParE family toxin [Planctomycetota bacterium]